MVVSGPTVIAYFATTQAESDLDPDAGEALNDFQHYLPTQREQLARDGVRLVESYADSILVRRDGASEWIVPRISVGYLLVAPGKRPRTIEGVMTDADLLAEAREYFARR